MSADESDQDAIQWEEARLWFARADDDLAVARLALDPLKGLLIAARLTAPKTHDLARLAPDVAAAFPTIAPLVAAVSPLTSWYLVGRYPDVDDAEPRRADIEAVLEDLHDLRRCVHELDPYMR